MKRVFLLSMAGAVALFLVVVSGAHACGDSTYIADVTVIPMTGGEVLEHQTVVVTGNRISQIGPFNGIPMPDGNCVVEGTGHFLMPGLVDAHAHLFDEGDLTLYLAHGVTSILNMSGSYQHLQFRDALASGDMHGPSLYTTGPTIKMSANPLVEFEDNPVDVAFGAELVRRHFDAGYDFIKVWGEFDPAVYRSMMDTARELDIPVTGHIPRPVGLDGVVDQGQRSIAHVEELFSRHFNNAPTPEGIAAATIQLADAGTTVTTTLVTYEAIAAGIAEDVTPLMTRDGIELMDPARQGMWAPGGNRYRTESRVGMEQRYLDQMAQMQGISLSLYEGGVRLLAGVDAGDLPGLVPGLDLHREFELLSEAGLPNEAVLATATQNFGAYLEDNNIGRETVGVIAVGARADLLLLTANPLEDISNTRAIAGVMTRGTYYDQAALTGLTDGLKARNEATAQYFGALVSNGAEGGAAHIANWPDDGTRPLGLVPTVFFAFGQAQQGDPVGAEATLVQVAGVYPERSEPWLIVAGLRAMMGNAPGALEAYDTALAIAPDHERGQRDRAHLVQAMAAN